MYELTDKKLAQLKKQIDRLFNRYRATISFDELNVINVIPKTRELYSELESLNDKVFLEIANYYYQEAMKDKEKKLSTQWLADILLGYDFITRYVYKHEVERKQAGLAESLMSSKTKLDNFKTARNLWWRQTYQYAINITDEALLKAYKDLGYKYVMWNTVIDGRECKTCRERNRKIYPIENARKQHYNCRCYWTPVKKVVTK